eukprot:CAMPEP_0172483460 /NCGR_PEP_ID=MMETSP1066-20121228/10484_1 /TAXON_ID=671091 /ORGANISM="Coscinodiscus wailesii, Strain CCMP2513" /LENGTH=293 /DNA_ID=CAMNT_0013247357 /DNA_START=103 /DNA_END=981 /DNA_ORIENTATION=-
MTSRMIIRRSIVQCRYISSSAFTDVSYIPNAIRKTIKSNLVDEITKSDSNIWQNDNAATTPKMANINGNAYHQALQSIPQSNEHMNNTYPSIDTPHRTLPPDPLTDWYLTTTPHRTLPHTISPTVDPFTLSAPLIENLSQNIRTNLLQSQHPVLQKAASYFFSSTSSGKLIRPTMILLLSHALSHHQHQQRTTPQQQLQHQRPDLPAAQLRLAEIAEMIHTASLFHDDVIDDGDTRRGRPTVHRVFGDKMAILAGDYLLARASVCLARLRHTEVVETMSGIIEDLVRGEVMQM